MTKIMLVEDDNNLREIYEARLNAEGYEIVSAENGEAALAMAAKERPDMIISDVMMPKISGFEMLDILRNTNSLKNVKIIMLTALGQAEDSQRANSLGADRYLVKSQVTLEDIVKAAHDLLDDPNKLANVPTLPGEEAAAETENNATEPAAPAVAEPTPAPAPDVTAPVEAPAVESTPVEDVPAAPAPEPVTDSSAMPVADPVAATDTPADDLAVAEPPVVAATEPVAAPADPVASQPVDQPAASPSVISIPVSDGGDGTSATPSRLTVVEPLAESETASEAPESGLPIVEPPTEPAAANETPEEAPADSATTAPVEAPAPDYTSPDSFNSFQAPESTSEVSNEAPAEPPLEAAQPTPEAPSEPDSQSTTPSVEIPSVVANPDTSSSTDLFSDTPAVSGPADPVPVAEELGGDMTPVISAPDGESVSTPQPIIVTDGNSTEETTEPAPEGITPATEFKDEQLREVAEDLAQSASDEASAETAATDSTVKPKGAVVSPLDNNKPNLDQLLAVEEAKSSAAQAAQATEPARPNVDAYNPSTAPAVQSPPAEDATDPNSIAL